MKECTYGWYPPAKDIWKNYRATPDSYERECLYKHSNSRYNSQPGVATPIQPTQIQLEIPPPSQRSTSPTRIISAKPPRPPTACSTSSSIARTRPSPRKAWTSYIPQTSMAPQPPSKSRDTAITSPTDPQPTHRPQRVQSAQHSHRPRISAKHRPIKSAGVTRSPESVHGMRRSASADSCRRSRPQSSKSVSKEYKSNRVQYHRPSSSHSLERGASIRSSPPPVVDYNEERHEEDQEINYAEEIHTPAPPPSPPPVPQYSTDSLQQGSSGAEVGGPMMYSVYENQLKEHGWRMQVHGDPLNLKAPCIAPRLPYTVEVPIPEVRGEGPKGYMVNYDTNFYNTIPRRRATFDVAQDWISEVLHAKRMELQKRDGGIKYRYKNFSFVY